MFVERISEFHLQTCHGRRALGDTDVSLWVQQLEPTHQSGMGYGQVEKLCWGYGDFRLCLGLLGT